MIVENTHMNIMFEKNVNWSTKPNRLVWFGSILKNTKIKPNQTDEDIIGSDNFLIKNRSKPNQLHP